jgi:FtsH-binding integral membrane protein
MSMPPLLAAGAQMSAELYLGLIVFLGYVVYDTQVRVGVGIETSTSAATTRWWWWWWCMTLAPPPPPPPPAPPPSLQMTIEKASAGDRDFVGHALELQIDFVALFVRIAIVLLRRSASNKKRRDSE